jgi:diaminohydroxyphosphoribosylaminopyrimidine deaminase/5-amino-6-(5-phosphoribosylamino)uracil reductase
MMKDVHSAMMRECLRLAAKGRGAVSPNPKVGAVIVRRGNIIGRGYHRKFGGPHAEVNALRACRETPRGATMYVNLEPCCHHGKTPPCTDAIIRSGITHVVVGMKDPHHLVRGGGIRALQRAGIRVTTGVEMQACRRLNEAFIKHATTGFPLITLKIAQSIDGAIADHTGHGRWITGEAARRDGHRRRAESDAVLTGAGTIESDNPRLTVRHVRGPQPVRIVLDGKLSVSTGARVFTGARKHPVVIMTTERAFVRHRRKVSLLAKKGVTFIIFPGARGSHMPVRDILLALGRRGITSVLVEGGPVTWGEFLNASSADKLFIYTAPVLIGGERRGFATLHPLRLGGGIKLKNITQTGLGIDMLLSADLSYSPKLT